MIEMIVANNDDNESCDGDDYTDVYVMFKKKQESFIGF